MKHSKLRTVGLGIAILLLGAPAAAQKGKAGTSKNEMPNVLLLVDTSGSMEKMPDGSPASCGINVTPNRWGSLVQALTGNLQPYYSCASQTRSGTAFSNEFGSSIYDNGYFLPFNRPLTGSSMSAMCGLTHQGSNLNQKLVDATTWSWGSPNSCTFDQADDGQLDIAKDLVRFGLMTFDNIPDKSTSAAGMWSYYVGSPKQGNLPACAAVDYEMGARNDNAPDWEGRLVRFPKKNAKLKDVRKQNAELQDILRSMRPYGGTPIDAMMDDAKDYLWNDTADADDAANDGSTKGGSACREEYIILLTDGAPNLDMRTGCQASGGNCPYPKKAYEIANDLNTNFGAKARVKTFVIGFSVNDTGPSSFPLGKATCREWYDAVTASSATPAAAASDFATACTTAPFTASGPAAGTAAAACCTLNQISVNGNGGPAFFAESQADLSAAMAKILGNIAKGDTTRTIPSYAGVSGANSSSATFLASFDPQPVDPWLGNISRERLQCDLVSGSPTFGQRVPVTPAQATGDDFGYVLEKQNLSGKRNVLLVNPSDIGAGKVDGGITLRPNAPASAGSALDGFVAETSTQKFGSADIATAFTSFFDDRVFETTSRTCPRSRDPKNTLIPALSALECAKVGLGFTLAQASGLSFGGYDFSKYRCPWDTTSSSYKCKPMGAIFHANPIYVGPPAAPLRDETYQDFARMYKTRPATLYVSSIDGLLHAFKSDETDATTKPNIEMWSFVPPAALKRVSKNMPLANQIIHDGQPVARDVVFERTVATVTPGSYGTGANAGKLWHTVLIGSFGEGSRGYYALDVTNPGPGTYDAGTAAAGSDTWKVASLKSTTERWPDGDSAQGDRIPGPQFLWQMVDVPDASGAGPAGPMIGKDNANRDRYSMFGKVSATPAIATLFFDPSTSGTGAAKEIAVAILPGGYEDDPVSGKCPRALGGYPSTANRSDSGFTPRSKVRKWATNCSDPVPGRSLTVVRLDTGEVVRVFSRREDRPRQLEVASRWTDAPLDSPMNGTPVVYPSGVGAVGQKVFIGDADGTVWRFDLSSPNPNNWEASLFLDTQAPGPSSAEDNGQPIIVTPVLSTDEAGRLVLSIATGDQEDLTAPVGADNYVYSVSETFGSAGAQAKVNWYKALVDGERVTGPMVVFDGLHIFATYKPPATSAAACSPGQANVYQWMYTTPDDSSQIQKGGKPVPFPAGSPVDPNANKPTAGIYDMGTDLVPGVSIRSLQACSSANIDDYTSSMPPSVASQWGGYELVIPQSKNGGAPGAGKAAKKTVTMPSLKRPTRIDSWAHIAD